MSENETKNVLEVPSGRVLGHSLRTFFLKVPPGGSRGVPGPPVQSPEAPFCHPLRGLKFKKSGPKTKKNAKSRRTEKVVFEAPLSHFSGVPNSREALLGSM